MNDKIIKFLREEIESERRYVEGLDYDYDYDKDEMFEAIRDKLEKVIDFIETTSKSHLTKEDKKCP